MDRKIAAFAVAIALGLAACAAGKDAGEAKDPGSADTTAADAGNTS